MRKDISKIIWRKFMESFQNLWIAWKAIACTYACYYDKDFGVSASILMTSHVHSDFK